MRKWGQRRAPIENLDPIRFRRRARSLNSNEPPLFLFSNSLWVKFISHQASHQNHPTSTADKALIAPARAPDHTGFPSRPTGILLDNLEVEEALQTRKTLPVFISLELYTLECSIKEHGRTKNHIEAKPLIV